MLNVLTQTSKKYIIGIDECGIGPIAGPVVVGAVKAPKEWFIEGLRDSKKLSKKNIKLMSEKILRLSNNYNSQFSSILENIEPNPEIKSSVSLKSSADVDALGIKEAAKVLYWEAIEKLGPEDSLIIIDGLKIKNPRYEFMPLVKADSIVPHVMAASIIAKAKQISEMNLFHVEYPKYLFGKHHGYPTPEHKRLLETFGPTPIHRRSFEPVKSMIKDME